MMSKEYNNYIIYKVVNKVNDMVYIGATTKVVDSRKKDHIQKANKEVGHKFHRAIKIFGPEAFEWKVIDHTANDIHELASKEKEYIIKYDSKENGLNGDNGGGISKNIFQFSIQDGSLVNTYDCLENASNAINASNKAISKTCLSVNQILKGFYWSYEYKEPFIPNSDNRKKEVFQYDLDGNFIAKYISVSEASRQTEVNNTSIGKACRNERNHAGGYNWIYK